MVTKDLQVRDEDLRGSSNKHHASADVPRCESEGFDDQYYENERNTALPEWEIPYMRHALGLLSSRSIASEGLFVNRTSMLDNSDQGHLPSYRPLSLSAT